MLEIASYAEWYSNHPIAKSIKSAYNKDVEEVKIEDVKEISGKGIRAIIDGKTVLVGNEKLMIENDIEYEKNKDLGTVLYIAIDGTFSGTIVISDRIKDDSIKCIKLIKESGIKNTIMLTGDKKEIAERMCDELGIDIVHSELLPDGKVEKMESVLKQKSQNKKIAFVGDGINDAPVLALADVGIAMGGLGSDSAIEAADIVIMTDEPSKISTAIKISKKTMRIVKENIVFAIFVKILVLILSALGLATMWGAVFADVGVSIIAILNSLRMLNKNI